MLIWTYRDLDDGERPYNNSGHRVRSVVTGVGNCTARMGGRTRRTYGFFLHNILHINLACRLLSFPRSCHRKTKLYLHGSCPLLLRSFSQLSYFLIYYFVLQSRGIFRYPSNLKSKLYTNNSFMLFIWTFSITHIWNSVSKSFCSLINGSRLFFYNSQKDQ